MKKIMMRLSALVLAFVTAFGLAACNDTTVKPGADEENTSLQRYFAPVVKVSKSGLATWTDLENAGNYIYKINDGEEQETTDKSVQLNLNDKITVKCAQLRSRRQRKPQQCDERIQIRRNGGSRHHKRHERKRRHNDRRRRVRLRV